MTLTLGQLYGGAKLLRDPLEDRYLIETIIRLQGAVAGLNRSGADSEKAEGLRDILGESKVLEFHINFFTDAFLCTLERWILDKNCVPPEKFIALLQSCVRIAADNAASFS